MEILPSILSGLVALVALVISIFSTTKKETKEDSTQTATLMAKLDSISEDIRDMKKDLTDLRMSVQDNHDRIIKLEISQDSLWKEINELRKR